MNLIVAFIKGHYKSVLMLIPFFHCSRKVFVQRDYTSGFLPVCFDTALPSALHDIVDAETVANAVNALNASCAKCDQPACCEATLASMTAHCSLLCWPSHYERGLSAAANLVEDQNRHLWEPLSLHLTDPTLRGLHVMEFTFLEDRAETLTV